MERNIPVSVYLVTLNEAEHLQEVLEPLKQFDEIILVDSGSTDSTVDIAKKNGAKVFHKDWMGFSKQKEYAMSLCKNEWVVNIDGDEVLNEAVVESIRKSVVSNDFEAYRLHFEDLFWNKPMSRYSSKRSIVRLFKKHVARYPHNRKVHENLILNKSAKVGSISGLVKHYGYNSTETLMLKQNRYSTLKALDKYDHGKKASILKLMLIFPMNFIKVYFFKRMFLSGIRGLVYSCVDSMYAFLKEAKLFEFNQQ